MNSSKDEPGALKPRAERFPIQTEVRFRQSGETSWNVGTSVNISSSGILFRAANALLPKTMLEMRILFPPEITGGSPANVICWGPVVRTEEALTKNSQPSQAAAILRYRFTHD